MDGPTLFAGGVIASWAGLVIALGRRSRGLAVFAGVIVGLHTLSLLLLARNTHAWLPVAAALHATVILHFASLLRPRLRPVLWRLLITWPSHWMVAATFFALPWAVLSIWFWPVALVWLPFALASIGLVQSLRARRETVQFVPRIDAGGPLTPRPTAARRVPGLDGGPPPEGHLKLVQITDPHLGPFMSEARLRAICERAVATNPDLIVLTGDFYTMDGRETPGALRRALAPLEAHPRVVAVRGNHDLEAPERVRSELESIGATLLIDESITIDTRLGALEIVGMDFHWRDREARISEVFSSLQDRRPRLVLQHDPGAFVHLPSNSADWVLSGHTHGGQLGLVSLGLQTTVIRLISSFPDHGPWTANGNLLYVHRATGHYGFPLRLGVPAEESVLLLPWPAP